MENFLVAVISHTTVRQDITLLFFIIWIWFGGPFWKKLYQFFPLLDTKLCYPTWSSVYDDIEFLTKNLT